MLVFSIKAVINHINSDALAEKDDDTSLAKDIKRHICTNLESRYFSGGRRVARGARAPQLSTKGAQIFIFTPQCLWHSTLS